MSEARSLVYLLSTRLTLCSVPFAFFLDATDHIYDVMGCYWNIPGNYDSGSFDQCNANLPAQAMGEYKLKNGQTSTWHQGVNVSRLTPPKQSPKLTSC